MRAGTHSDAIPAAWEAAPRCPDAALHAQRCTLDHSACRRGLRTCFFRLRWLVGSRWASATPLAARSPVPGSSPGGAPVEHSCCAGCTFAAQRACSPKREMQVGACCAHRLVLSTEASRARVARHLTRHVRLCHPRHALTHACPPTQRHRAAGDDRHLRGNYAPIEGSIVISCSSSLRPGTSRELQPVIRARHRHLKAL